MSEKKYFTNGQKIHELIGVRRTYFFISGKIKAEGLFIMDQMESEWKFYRETGQLCQIGHFKKGKESCSCIR
jgi:antitoxin component YwqK of YwqJK toxin-antitoxin module